MDQLIYLICIEGIFCADFLPFSHFGKIAMPVNNVIHPNNFALFSYKEYVEAISRFLKPVLWMKIHA